MNHLIKISFLVFGSCLCFLSATYAQIRQNFYAPKSFYQVTSYLGYQTLERSTVFQFDIDDAAYNLSKWSLSVRLASPVTIREGGPSRSGKMFPLNKLSFTWNMNNYQKISPQSIGVNTGEIILNEASEVFLVTNSQAPLTGFGQFLIENHFRVLQGKYLDDYQSGLDQWTYITYNIPLVFQLYDAQKKPVGVAQPVLFNVQIAPKLTDGNMVDVEPEYSLQLGPEASNAILRFVSTKDYKDGVSLLLKDAVKVNAKTNFELRVKALDTELARTGGGALPLSILSTQLTPGTGARPVTSNPVIQLSTTEKVLLSGTSVDKKNAQYFDLNYRAKLTPEQVTSVKTGEYSLSLLYLLLPK